MGKIECDKRTVTLMVNLYCRFKLNQSELSMEYRELIRYAHLRLEHCRFGNQKPSCRRCEIHCYSPIMRDRIKLVMRWAGPRMLFLSPMAAFRHMRNK